MVTCLVPLCTGGVVAAIRFGFSISRKPFHSYEFHRQLVDLVMCYLKIFPPTSDETLRLRQHNFRRLQCVHMESTPQINDQQ